jgi:non-specific serine/threonine protein kinase
MCFETAATATPAAPELYIRLLGPFSVRMGGCPLPPMRTRKGAWLLALLILRHDRPVDRLRLASTLWPDSEESAARKNLRNTLNELRHALGRHSFRLQAPTPATLGLDLSDATVDLLAFDAAIAKRDSPVDAVRHYSGPLLEGCTEEWASLERHRREQQYLEALEALAEIEVQSGRVSWGVLHLRTCIGIDPLREGAQRALMAALADHGDYTGALQVYRAFRILVHELLQASPAAETTTLYERIRARARQDVVSPMALPSPESAASSRAAPAETPDPAQPRRDLQIHNLPIQHTRFIGREPEIAQVKNLLSGTKLLTLTGSGGCGKTRLALQVAAEAAVAYPDGVWLVELASQAEPTLVPEAVASVLSVKTKWYSTVMHALLARLTTARQLLVLDNCEHLLSACADLASAVLAACPGVTILATSRERLSVAGEQNYRVPSLSLPEVMQPLTTETAHRYEAVRLFLDRARLINPGFELTQENVPVIARICRRLDGIPLAIELASARMNSLTVTEVCTRLDYSFSLLSGGNRTAHPRQQTLRALIDWSYQLLSGPERLLLQRLSVFVGSWTLEAAEQVCAGDGVDSRQVLDLLIDLADKSLVIADTRGRTSRYHLLETVRQFSHDQLADSGGIGPARSAHRDYFLQLAERIGGDVFGPIQAAGLAELEEAHDNLRAALVFCLNESSGAEKGLRLVETLEGFWRIRGRQSEWRELLAALLSQLVGPDLRVARVRALRVMAEQVRLQGDLAVCRSLHEESLAICAELGDKRGIARSLRSLGNLDSRQHDYASARSRHQDCLVILRELDDTSGIFLTLQSLIDATVGLEDYPASRGHAEEALEISRRSGDRFGEAASLSALGSIALARGDQDTARAHFNESLAMFRDLEDAGNVAFLLSRLGLSDSALGNYDAARAMHAESLANYRPLGNAWCISFALNNLGVAAHHMGDISFAHSCLTESLVLRRDHGNHWEILDSVEIVASFSMRTDREEHAARLLGAVSALRETLDRYVSSVSRGKLESLRTALRVQLGTERLDALWAEGQRMTRDQVAAYALREVS